MIVFWKRPCMEVFSLQGQDPFPPLRKSNVACLSRALRFLGGLETDIAFVPPGSQVDSYGTILSRNFWWRPLLSILTRVTDSPKAGNSGRNKNDSAQGPSISPSGLIILVKARITRESRFGGCWLNMCLEPRGPMFGCSDVVSTGLP